MSTSESQTIEQCTVSGRATQDVSALLPAPAKVDVGLAVAQMELELAYTSRKQAREDRQHAERALLASEERQLASMRHEAEKKHDATVIEAWCKIGEGVAALGGGLASAGALGRKATLPGRAETVTASGKVGSGVGGLFAAGSKHAADMAGVDAKQAENEAAAYKRAREGAVDELTEAREHIRTALDFLREFRSAESKSMSTAIRA